MNLYSFDKLVGNSNTFVLFRRMLENNTFPPFTIFEGSMGTGKSTSAKLTAMRLTCENPNGANPCCQCDTCKRNIIAFDSTGESPRVKIVNVGKFNTTSEVKDLIKDVFVLKSGEQSVVYVFEEVHALKQIPGAQTAFLEEMDRMPKNTYVIMCTTRVHDVIKELENRAITFTFKTLNEKESMQLVNQISPTSSPTMKNLIVKNSRGIPRSIIKGISFVTENQVTEDEYREFINEISDETFVLIFQSLNDVASMSLLLNDLTSARSIDVIVKRLKEFLVKAIFTVDGNIDCGLSYVTKDAIKEIFTYSSLDKIIQLLSSGCKDESDLLFFFMKVRLLLADRTMKDVYLDSPHEAKEEKSEMIQNRQSQPTGRVLTPLRGFTQ